MLYFPLHGILPTGVVMPVPSSCTHGLCILFGQGRSLRGVHLPHGSGTHVFWVVRFVYVSELVYWSRVVFCLLL